MHAWFSVHPTLHCFVQSKKLIIAFCLFLIIVLIFSFFNLPSSMQSFFVYTSAPYLTFYTAISTLYYSFNNIWHLPCLPGNISRENRCLKPNLWINISALTCRQSSFSTLHKLLYTSQLFFAYSLSFLSLPIGMLSTILSFPKLLLMHKTIEMKL